MYGCMEGGRGGGAWVGWCGGSHSASCCSLHWRPPLPPHPPQHTRTHARTHARTRAHPPTPPSTATHARAPTRGRQRREGPLPQRDLLPLPCVEPPMRANVDCEAGQADEVRQVCHAGGLGLGVRGGWGGAGWMGSRGHAAFSTGARKTKLAPPSVTWARAPPTWSAGSVPRASTPRKAAYALRASSLSSHCQSCCSNAAGTALQRGGREGGGGLRVGRGRGASERASESSPSRPPHLVLPAPSTAAAPATPGGTAATVLLLLLRRPSLGGSAWLRGGGALVQRRARVVSAVQPNRQAGLGCARLPPACDAVLAARAAGAAAAAQALSAMGDERVGGTQRGSRALQPAVLGARGMGAAVKRVGA